MEKRLNKSTIVVSVIAAAVLIGLGSYALSLSTTTSSNSIKTNSPVVDKNILNEEDFIISYSNSVSVGQYCEVNLANQELLCDYQYFVFKIKDFYSHTFQYSTSDDSITFKNGYKQSNFVYNSLMTTSANKDYWITITTETVDEWTYITMKYDKQLANDNESILGSNISSLTYDFMIGEAGFVTDKIEDYVFSAVYQNKDGVMLEPTSLFE